MTAAAGSREGIGDNAARFGAPRTRVALVIANLANRSGGAERIFVELANMLVARGYEVTCIHFEAEEGKPFYPLDRRVELINVFPRFRSERRWPWNMLNSKRLPDRIRQPSEWHLKKDPVIRLLRDYFRHTRPDVAISFLPPANTLTLLASIGTGVKVIPTNHNVPARDYLDPTRWSTNPHDRVLRLKALRHAAAIHVLFPDFGKWFPDALQSKIVVVPNYVSHDVLRHRPGERENLIIGVGRLAPVKNFMALIEAWALLAAKHPDWRVVVYGDGPQREKLAARIEELGLGGSFLLGGSRSDMGEVYAHAAIFCHPAEFEGFGLAPAEALALKMPVVAFADCPGVNQFVADGVNGIMADRAGGAEALAAALDRLIVDGALRQRLGDNGPASVATFTEEHFADAWVELIERCLDRR
ncbi:MAG: glycosyltransferase [Bauldia sp.]|uniref:glycosyltransferase n=1 Tax=Bauldia sp. TaxID=2575872 RepID=UPI001E09AE4E|nr:glycosyltransferase [Bauldia sp.]MCB1495953.1 glycosyltransferase [Bauldia sp.]